MRILERIKRWIGMPRSFDSVVAELVDGLRNGSITLETPATDSQQQSTGLVSPSGSTPSPNGNRVGHHAENSTTTVDPRSLNVQPH